MASTAFWRRVCEIPIAIVLSALLCFPPFVRATETAKVAEAKRIVSLAPSDTELIFAIHANERLVGVSSYCDYPPEAKKIEKVGTFVSANLERLTRLKPDLVLLVSGQEALAGVLSHNGFHVVVVQNAKLSDISGAVRTIGSLTGHAGDAEKVAKSFDESLQGLQSVLRSAKDRPKVFFCVWPQPLLTVGKSSFINDAISASGGANIAASMNAAYPNFSPEKLISADPDLLVLPHGGDKKMPMSRPPWSSLRAVKTGRISYLPEAEKDGLLRPTLRSINGLDWLARNLHPQLASSLDKWHADAEHKLGL